MCAHMILKYAHFHGLLLKPSLAGVQWWCNFFMPNLMYSKQERLVQLRAVGRGGEGSTYDDGGGE